ncbi:MAG TPA: chaperone modulator CbpM [Lacunisphaera sp.]
MNEPAYSATTVLQRFEMDGDEIYPIETVTHLAQVSRHQIAVYCRHGLIAPVSAPERDGWWFDPATIRMLRQLEWLRDDYHMDLAALQVTARLFREIEQLRDEVRSLRKETGSGRVKLNRRSD